MKKLLNNKKLQIAMAVMILILLTITLVVIKVRMPKEGTVETYTYTNVAEQVLANEVIVYLQNAAGLGDAISAKTGNEAVETYRSIIRSDVDVVNDDHTQAIQERIGSALKEYAVEEDEELSAEDVSALSAGVAELVWQSILSQIETVTENVAESEYFYLAESLQQQIQELEDRKMKVSIKANIKNNMDLSADELLSIVDGMTDKELEDLAKSLGISMEELQKLLEIYKSEIYNEIDSRIKEKLKELEREIIRELQKTSGKDGEKGERGADGKDGKDGKDGSTGKSVFIRYSENSNGIPMTESPTEKTRYMGTYSGTKASTKSSDYSWSKYVGDDGAEGNSIFIRYSENASGMNMTERPTAATKYMGTYRGTKASTNPSEYSWTKYVGDDGNSVFIRYAEDANGKKMSETPNSNTKYMGTYIGTTASNNPSDYTWTRYSDATISFSDGTLYITQ